MSFVSPARLVQSRLWYLCNECHHVWGKCLHLREGEGTVLKKHEAQFQPVACKYYSYKIFKFLIREQSYLGVLPRLIHLNKRTWYRTFWNMDFLFRTLLHLFWSWKRKRNQPHPNTNQKKPPTIQPTPLQNAPTQNLISLRDRYKIPYFGWDAFVL